MSEPPLTEKSNLGQDGDKTPAADKPASRHGSAKSQRSNFSGRIGDVPPPIDDLKDNPASDLRNMRRIIAEDPEWSLATVPLMVELCLKHIVDNFESMLYW